MSAEFEIKHARQNMYQLKILQGLHLIKAKKVDKLITKIFHEVYTLGYLPDLKGVTQAIESLINNNDIEFCILFNELVEYAKNTETIS